MTLILNKEDIKKVLTMRETINILEKGFREFGLGRVRMPQRHVIRVTDGACIFMPACLESQGAVGIKVVTYFKNNPSDYGLPSILATVMLLDPASGKLLAIMDGEFLTAMRTGAASGLATKYLAREQACVLGVLGSGAQAVAQIAAVCEVRPIKRVKVFSPNLKSKRDRFLRELTTLMISDIEKEIQIADSAEEAVRGSDVIVLASSATEPIINGDWVENGSHINAIGGHTPSTRELDTQTVVRSKIICDSVEACLVEAGDLLIPIAEGRLKREDVTIGLGDVVLDESKGRASDNEITLFKSVGLAFEDISTALFVHQSASRQTIGVQFEFN